MRVDILKQKIVDVNIQIRDFNYALRKGVGFYAIDLNDKYSKGDLEVSYAGSKQECSIFLEGLLAGLALSRSIK